MIFIIIDEHTILEYRTLNVNTQCSDKAGYQTIKTITECKSAVIALGKSVTVDLLPIEYTIIGMPPGCIFDTRERRTYFNPAEYGKAAPQAAPICGKQGKEKYLAM